jgi:hypothetical protein
MRAIAAVAHDAVIRVCDEAGNVIETHERAGEFQEPQALQPQTRSRDAVKHDG